MNNISKILTFVLAGGRGERLDPLTRDRTKPAVPFGGIYRIIDFTLSNCINSGLRRIYVLTQYKSFSLQKHLLAGWDIVATQLGEFIDIVPAQQRINSDWYKGTADAIYQNLYALYDYNPQLVLILAGDHVYRMNYQHMIKHHKTRDADVTVACIPFPKESSVNFGVVEIDDNDHVCGFQEKPQDPKTIPGDPTTILASMGIYLFNRDVLIEELENDANTDSDHDFGKNVIPQMLCHGRKIYVHRFVDEHNQPRYWRDIGTRDAYYQSNMDLLNSQNEFNINDRTWPIRTYHEQYPPVRIITTRSGHGAIINSMVAGGCIIEGGYIEYSVVSSDVRVAEGARIKNSVIMEGVVIGEGAQIQNAIIDKEVTIPPYTKIGYDVNLDRKRFVLTTSGIVIVPKKMPVFA